MESQCASVSALRSPQREKQTPAYEVESSDIWAIGVITYFLLCGYTPFDRDSNIEEMQAILVADYSFTPVEYWRGVSEHGMYIRSLACPYFSPSSKTNPPISARDFIRRCLTIDATQRMTAHEALSHAFVAEETQEKEADLLPIVKKNFNARRTLHAAIDTIRAINKLREGGAAMMSGAMTVDPKPGQQVNDIFHAVAAATATAAGASRTGGPDQQIDTPMPDRTTPTQTPKPSNKGLWSPPTMTH